MRKTVIEILRKYDIEYSSKTNTQKLIKKLKNSSSVNWYRVSEELSLSEEFIKEFQDKVYWVYVSIFQKLSEDFIRKMRNKVNWVCLANRDWSDQFKKEFEKQLWVED